MTVSSLSDAIAVALTRLHDLQQSPNSPIEDKQFLALNSELRKLHKVLGDKINALAWNEEKKQLQVLRKKLDRTLSSSEYQIEVNISEKRVNELERKLSINALNDSQRRRIQKELRQIRALRRKFVEQNRTKQAGEPAALTMKTTTQKIEEYQALKARALGSCTGES